MKAHHTRTLALVAGTVFVSTAGAQQYQRSYGTPNAVEQAQDVTQAFASTFGFPDGAISVGSQDMGGFPPAGDVLVVRHGPVGGIVWSEAIDFGGFFDSATSIWPIFATSPEPHYAVAGVTDALSLMGIGGIETLVTRLAPDGTPLWGNAYRGTTPSESDLVHVFRRDELGPQVVEYPDGSLVVIGNYVGRPLAMRIDATTGAPLFISSYIGPMSETVIGVTDVRVVDDRILVIGSIEEEFGEEVPTDVDVFAMLLAPDLSLIMARRYDITFAKPGGGEFPSSEWGHALAESSTGSAMVISGVTDYRDPAPPFGAGQAAPFTLAIDPITLAPLSWFTYDPLLGAPPGAAGPIPWVNGYGAQDFDLSKDRNVLAGTLTSPGGTEFSAAFSVDPFTGVIDWSQRYARTSNGRGVDVADATCGVFVAGQVDGTTPPLTGVTGSIADHVTKTQDMGRTGCNEDKVDLLTLPAQFNSRPVQLTQVSHDEFMELDPQIVSEVTDDVFCFSVTCSCPGDIADSFGTPGPDGMVDFGDFLALLGLVGPCPGMTPGCLGDIADSFGTLPPLGGPDGKVDFGDFLALLGLVGPCP